MCEAGSGREEERVDLVFKNMKGVKQTRKAILKLRRRFTVPIG
ncbi:hypothetical protein BIW11_03075 [Tropilaelaps mercedesae]|uniref:Uncharacterized protein n=1 Tax=Tropilaelaps mercedesae TaxID=418985 RepID=A0A1V9XSQ5_9ACAR|nr:hypothetical protein BIW11_03075 [Tropilaelaps mercedesae]